MHQSVTVRTVLLAAACAALTRLLTPTWGAWDYLGLIGMVLGALVLLLIFVGMFVSVTDLDCPVKAFVADRLGYDYHGGFMCEKWVKRTPVEKE